MWQTGAIGSEPAGETVVEGGTIPYKPEALEKKKANFANRSTNDPEAKCYMPGIPRANYMPYPFQIVQSPRGILFVYEFASANRLVNMGKPQEAGSDTWMGTNNGHWEGDTLVVDVTGFERTGVVRPRGRFRQQTSCTWWSDSRRPDPVSSELRSHHRRSDGVFAAVENQHAALPEGGEERAASGIQVRGVRRRIALRTVQEAAGQIVEAADPAVAAHSDLFSLGLRLLKYRWPIGRLVAALLLPWVMAEAHGPRLSQSGPCAF